MGNRQRRIAYWVDGNIVLVIVVLVAFTVWAAITVASFIIDHRIDDHVRDTTTTTSVIG